MTTTLTGLKELPEKNHEFGKTIQLRIFRPDNLKVNLFNKPHSKTPVSFQIVTSTPHSRPFPSRIIFEELLYKVRTKKCINSIAVLRLC